MERKQLQNASLAGTVLLAVIVVIVSSYVIWSSWPQLEASQQSSVAANGIGAMGTLLLAVATLWTVLHSSQQMEKREHENEKPLARNEVVHLTQPAIDALRNNIDCLEDDYKIEWLFYDPSHRYNFTLPSVHAAGEPTPVISTKNPHALVRLEKERPDLYQKLQEHDEMLHDLAMRADEIGERIDDQLHQFIDENNLDSTFTDESDIRTLKSSILREIREYGKTHDHYDAWNEHRESFLDILYSNAGTELEDFHSLEETYQQHCTSLLRDLKKRRFEIQEEYGFVVEDETEIEAEETIGGRVT